MTFDRSAYQREYMKEYMRKRRAVLAECQQCDIFKKYCDGKHKSGRCMLEGDTPLETYQKQIDRFRKKEGLSSDGSTSIIPVFIPENMLGLLFKIRNEDEDEGITDVLGKLLRFAGVEYGEYGGIVASCKFIEFLKEEYGQDI